MIWRGNATSLFIVEFFHPVIILVTNGNGQEDKTCWALTVTLKEETLFFKSKIRWASIRSGDSMSRSIVSRTQYIKIRKIDTHTPIMSS
jgi:hypothetical protein